MNTSKYPSIKNGTIYLHVFHQHFNTVDFYIEDFNQKNEGGLTPLEICLFHQIGSPEIYNILFEKTDLSKINVSYILLIIKTLSFSYENKIYEKIPQYLNAVEPQNYQYILNILKSYSTTASFYELEENTLYPKEFSYFKEGLKQCFLTAFDYFENLKITPEENFKLFLYMNYFDITEAENLFLKINLNFEKELKNFSSHKDVYKSLFQTFEEAKALQEKHKLENVIDYNDNNSNNKIIFKI